MLIERTPEQEQRRADLHAALKGSLEDNDPLAPCLPSPCWLQPLAFNVVVELDPVEEVTAGGIILIPQETEREKHAIQTGTLVAKSPHAFTYVKKWPDHSPPPDVGARVLVSRYAGLLKEKDGKDYRIVEDKHVIAVIGEE